ncbi:hypothetical protein EDD85DRAFT_276393 [Armillaria nabsnona]|nr:hypothetical protein EDD85DRAFT_276393 [Armillaria nabsnona]
MRPADAQRYGDGSNEEKELAIACSRAIAAQVHQLCTNCYYQRPCSTHTSSVCLTQLAGLDDLFICLRLLFLLFSNSHTVAYCIIFHRCRVRCLASSLFSFNHHRMVVSSPALVAPGLSQDDVSFVFQVILRIRRTSVTPWALEAGVSHYSTPA